MTEFDYQWKNLPRKDIEYNDLRVKEFLLFTKLNPEKAILGRDTLDAGCGIGRYTYAIQKHDIVKVAEKCLNEYKRILN